MARKESEADREARRTIAQAQIRQFPDPVLRSPALPVEEFDAALEELVERMCELADDAIGAGLAAPQIGLLRRLAVISFEDDEWIVLINPEIIEHSEETEVGGEGCLSLEILLKEQHSVPVERSTRITVRWQDEDGDWQEDEFLDMPARIVQHEVDHLNGILTIDRAAPADKREALKILRERLS
jgi:peptide deformylase